eukprot:10161941-Lingulodinium_polyedra.AAC.1
MSDQPPRDIARRCTTGARRAYPRGQGKQCHKPGILLPAAAPALRTSRCYRVSVDKWMARLH